MARALDMGPNLDLGIGVCAQIESDIAGWALDLDVQVGLGLRIECALER